MLWRQDSEPTRGLNIRPAWPDHQTQALVGLLLFVIWTVVVRAGISEGSRHTVWVGQPFGHWPASFASLAGSANVSLSLHASYASGGTVGSTTVGTTTDFGDPANINGSRFVTGRDAGWVTSMSVHVGAPIDVPPYDQFEVAIYEDHRGAPGRLLARSARGTLMPNAWNSVPVSLVLHPLTPYWFMYNTNGSSDHVNNLTMTPLVANPVDAVIRAPAPGLVDRLASLFKFLAHPVMAVTATLLLAWRVGFSRRWLALFVLGATLVAASAVEVWLKWVLFSPYGSYPSGHVLRATFLASLVLAFSHVRSVRTMAILLAVLSCLGTIRTNGHYAEEALGGVLLGWTCGAAATAILSARRASHQAARESHLESGPRRRFPAFPNRRRLGERRRGDRRRPSPDAPSVQAT